MEFGQNNFFREIDISIIFNLLLCFSGIHTGAIASLEQNMGVVLFWVICLLHFLESPLRHMLERWDGKGNDPVTTGGPIGKAIKDLHKPKNLKKFVKFSNAPFKNVRLPNR